MLGVNIVKRAVADNILLKEKVKLIIIIKVWKQKSKANGFWLYDFFPKQKRRGKNVDGLSLI
jgi:hypothetical protein